MNTARIMEDGDLRLPPDMSQKLNAKPSDSLGIELDADGTIRLYPKTFDIGEVCGMLKPKEGIHLSVEEKDEAVAASFRRGEL